MMSFWTTATMNIAIITILLCLRTRNAISIGIKNILMIDDRISVMLPISVSIISSVFFPLWFSLRRDGAVRIHILPSISRGELTTEAHANLKVFESIQIASTTAIFEGYASFLIRDIVKPLELLRARPLIFR